jgi:hypothetical protein
VDIDYPPPGTGRTGNHGIDLAAIGDWLYFIEPRIGKIGRLTVQSGTGSLSNLVQFSGLDPSLEPFPGLTSNAAVTLDAKSVDGTVEIR